MKATERPPGDLPRPWTWACHGGLTRRSSHRKQTGEQSANCPGRSAGTPLTVNLLQGGQFCSAGLQHPQAAPGPTPQHPQAHAAPPGSPQLPPDPRGTAPLPASFCRLLSM